VCAWRGVFEGLLMDLGLRRGGGGLTCLGFEDRCTGTCAMQAKEAHRWWGRRMCLEGLAGRKGKQ
jgi:hypothetical protein